MNLDNVITKFHLTPTEINILTYLTQAPAQITIRELAEKTFVSPATIIHLAKKMHFSGYSELLFSFNRERETISSNMTESSLIKQYGEEFSKLLITYQDKLIVFMGVGFSLHLAHYMSDLLTAFGFRTICNTYEEFIQQQFSDKALIVFVSNSGNTEYLLHLAHIASKNSVTSLLFTGNPSAELSQTASLTICTESYTIFRYNTYKPQLFFGRILIYFEILIAYTMKKIEDQQNSSTFLQ